MKKFILSIMTVLLVAALIGCAQTVETSKSTTAEKSQGSSVRTSSESTKASASEGGSTAKKSSIIEAVNPKSKIEFKNIVGKTNMGFTTIIGEVSNTDSKLHSFTLKVSFYDKNKKLLGTAPGAVNELNGGATKIFTAMAADDYSKAVSYKVQVDTMVTSSENKKVPIEFSNVIIKNNMGLPTVEGEAKNNDTSAHSFTIVIGLYDANKKLIGTAAGAINDIAAGDTMTFTAMGTASLKGVKSYKVQVDTMVN